MGVIDRARVVADRARPTAASFVRTSGLWALNTLGRFLQRNEALPGFSRPELSASSPSLALVDEAFARHLKAHPDDTYAATAAKLDRIRYSSSVDWLRAVVRPGDRILELGGSGVFSQILSTAFPEARVDPGSFELRTPFPIRDEQYDVVLCMEVIEHVCDVEYHHATTLSGVKRCLSEIRRVLKPGGTLFLTTPNAAGATVLHRALRHEAPWNWEYHFREFTVFELQALVKEAGLTLERLDTVQAWGWFGTAPQILAFMWLTGASVHARGDNTFLVAKRHEPV